MDGFIKSDYLSSIKVRDLMISIIDPQSALPNCKSSPTPRRSITNPSGSTFYTPGVDFHANRFSDLAFRLTELTQ